MVSDVIRQLIGTPFRYGGRSADGLDCYGVVLAWWEAHGTSLSDPLRVTDAIEGCGYDVFDANQGSEWQEVRKPFSEGDVLTFARKNGSDLATHCGVYLKGDRILHATEKAGVVITRLQLMRQRFRKAYRPLWRD